MAVSGSPAGRAYVQEDAWDRASLADRTGAWLIDMTLLVVVVLAVATVLGLTGSRLGTWVADDGTTTTANATYIPAQWSGLLLALASALYAIPMWRLNRATLGQRLRNLRVVDASEPRSLSWPQASVRWLVLFGWAFVVMGSGIAALSGICTILFVAWFAVLILTVRRGATAQGLHDSLARTLVEKRTTYKVVAPKHAADSRAQAPGGTAPGSSPPPTTEANPGPRRSTRKRPAKG